MDGNLYNYKPKQDVCYSIRGLTCMLMLSICAFGGKEAQNIC